MSLIDSTIETSPEERNSQTIFNQIVILISYQAPYRFSSFSQVQFNSLHVGYV